MDGCKQCKWLTRYGTDVGGRPAGSGGRAETDDGLGVGTGIVLRWMEVEGKPEWHGQDKRRKVKVLVN